MACWDILFSCWLGLQRVIVDELFFSLCLSFFFPFLSLLICSSDFSVEHLAPRRSCGWGSVTFDEWIHLWLTPLLSVCLILTCVLFLSQSLIFSFSEPSCLPFWPLLLTQDRGVAALIGLSWTLPLSCISYDHCRDSLRKASCEVWLCIIVWTFHLTELYVCFPGRVCKSVINYLWKVAQIKTLEQTRSIIMA